ncbi:nucleotidyltransferase domain-containing protein [Thermoflexibacter ruber]|uniref:Predicted nucleotidyltransferase n=1 Tax=Thermoflexibacter ruber TaxID=1003 RepID=A0A1I2K5N6_9BACT|nr:nucleotidyltransferase domain-containing protein [Thermoflexibacter ruber]SFF60371.1 Predicted nucleotidyltransferase [Thermoflexibacter ruber]SFF61390.1 Predicted nucleotidyltransferase [Thermoflexibacter ruber]
MEIGLIISEFKKIVEQIYGERLSKVILYGSQARGEAKPDSDIDLLVVLKDEHISLIKEIRTINQKVIDLILQYDKPISFLPVTQTKFETHKSPLFYFIRKEGKEV